MFSWWLVVLSLSSIFGPVSGQFDTNCAQNRRGEVLVHLFSWRWKDVAKECERFLGPKGFCGVQISPPNEHRIVTSPYRPWWERYQPVSYKLDSASGSRKEFIDMVKRCNAVGVRIYADVVINHMAGSSSGTGKGSGGSYYDTRAKSFSGVPYGSNDFHASCKTSSGMIERYDKDADQVRNCMLSGLLDLNGGSNYVRSKIAEYLNDMINIGIAGVRIDAAKHMWPNDIEGTLKLVKRTRFGRPLLIYQEVIDLYGTESVKASEYKNNGKITEFKYGLKMADVFLNGKTALTHLKNFGEAWSLMSDKNALVFVDNHDNQRGHGGGGGIVTFKNSYAYKMATIFMLSWPYGTPRVMSSYDFHEDWTGPPSGSPGDGATCKNGWICEHRWRQITNMVGWRNSAGPAGVRNWWSNGNNQIAYSRGSSSFIAFNKQDGQMDEWLTTGLPSGTYCDIISGDLVNGRCSGRLVTVHKDTKAHIVIDGVSSDPVLAIHTELFRATGVALIWLQKNINMNDEEVTAGAMISTSTTIPKTTVLPLPNSKVQRTIVFIKKQTKPGDQLFIRGGCGSSCTIPIKYSPFVGQHFDSYNAWAVGDTKLDWTGPERSQKKYKNKPAQGSPLVWTSNQKSSVGYVTENSFGDHYWMWDVLMDCSKLNNGQFELKGYFNGNWESDIKQTTCTGDSPVGIKISTTNHVARCGQINVFEWNKNSCTVMNMK